MTSPRPKWTVCYNINSKESRQWIGRGWEFFDIEDDAEKARARLTLNGNVVTKRHFHINDAKHLGACHMHLFKKESVF